LELEVYGVLHCAENIFPLCRNLGDRVTEHNGIVFELAWERPVMTR
jgi:hypothetical protein